MDWYDAIPKWVRKYKRTIRSITGIVPTKLLGSGGFGYAYRTSNPKKVLKITTHRAEAKTCAAIMQLRRRYGSQLFPSVVKIYHISHVAAHSPPAKIFLIVREYTQAKDWGLNEPEDNILKETIEELKSYKIYAWDVYSGNIGLARARLGKRKKGDPVLFDPTADCRTGKVKIPHFEIG